MRSVKQMLSTINAIVIKYHIMYFLIQKKKQIKLIYLYCYIKKDQNTLPYLILEHINLMIIFKNYATLQINGSSL